MNPWELVGWVAAGSAAVAIGAVGTAIVVIAVATVVKELRGKDTAGGSEEVFRGGE
jgi:hypothetical protein